MRRSIAVGALGLAAVASVAPMKARAECLPETMAKPGWAEVQRACPMTEVPIGNMIMKTQPVTK